MPLRATLLTLGALVCFAATYRFASHGIRAKDYFCIGLAAVAAVFALLLLGFALRKGRRQRD